MEKLAIINRYVRCDLHLMKMDEFWTELKDLQAI